MYKQQPKKSTLSQLKSTCQSLFPFCSNNLKANQFISDPQTRKQSSTSSASLLQDIQEAAGEEETGNTEECYSTSSHHQTHQEDKIDIKHEGMSTETDLASAQATLDALLANDHGRMSNDDSNDASESKSHSEALNERFLAGHSSSNWRPQQDRSNLEATAVQTLISQDFTSSRSNIFHNVPPASRKFPQRWSYSTRRLSIGNNLGDTHHTRRHAHPYGRDSSKRWDGHASLSLFHLERSNYNKGGVNEKKEDVERPHHFRLEKSLSSTLHVGSRLGEALEKHQMQQQQIKDPMSEVVADIPFELEPDEEELQRRSSYHNSTSAMENMEESLEATVFQIARKQFESDFERSKIKDLTGKFPQFDLDEILLGLLLGKGSFAQVIEVRGFALKESSSHSSTSNNTNKNLRALTKSIVEKRHNIAGIHQMFDCCDDDEEDSIREVSPLKGRDADSFDPESSFIQKPPKEALSYYHGIIDDVMEEVKENIPGLAKLDHRGTTDHELGKDERRWDSTVNSINHMHHNESCHSARSDSSRRFIAQHSHRPKENDPHKSEARYALKQLQRKITQDPHTFMQGISDMAIETRVLSSLVEHPNLIKLRGIARGSNIPFCDNYFVLLDRLYDTLEQRIRKWCRQEQKCKKIIPCFFKGNKLLQRRKEMWMDRMTFARDLSSAVAYLHKNHVIHRDIKPANIGFDVRGDIKIFDLGLAKEVPTVDNGTRNLFNFTATCGSPRYMAPEVGMNEPYNELCDVYSLGILIWEMMSLTKPYEDIMVEGLVHEVWRGSDATAKRPSPNLDEQAGRFLIQTGQARRYWFGKLRGRESVKQAIIDDGLPVTGTPASLQSLLKACWSCKLERRPSMHRLEGRLQDELVAFRIIHNFVADEDDSGRVRRRSTYIFEAE